jgi:plasmid stabilization system protein ParE
MKIRYSPQARDDLHNIFHYLNERSPSGAENVMRAIYASTRFWRKTRWHRRKRVLRRYL